MQPLRDKPTTFLLVLGVANLALAITPTTLGAAALMAWDRGWLELSDTAVVMVYEAFGGSFAGPSLASAGVALAALFFSGAWTPRMALITSAMLLVWVGSLVWGRAELAVADAAEAQGPTVERIGDRIYWCRGFDYTSAAEVVRLAHDIEGRAPTLVLKSNPGGATAAMFYVLAHLKERSIPVEASAHCASACALLWLAAPERLLRIDSVIGLHGEAMSVLGRKFPSRTREAEYAAMMARSGMDVSQALELISPAAISTVNWLSASRLRELGVQFDQAPAHPDDSLACDNSRRPVVALGTAPGKLPSPETLDAR